MTRPRARGTGDWRKAVMTAKCKPVVKLCCVYLADHMDAGRKFSRPRHLIARDLGVSERTVTRMIEGAIEAKLLSPVRRGQKGVTAKYQGMFPDPVRTLQRDNCCPAETDQNCPAETGKRAVQRDNSCPTSSNGSGHRPRRRDVGNYEKTGDQPARSDLTVCDCHGFIDCASLDQPPTREASA